MRYRIEQIIPFHLSGYFQKDGNYYAVEFTHPSRELGILYIEGNAFGVIGKIKTSDIITFQSLYQIGFQPVLDKISSLHKVSCNVTLQHYSLLVLISPPNGNMSFTQFVSVIFTDTLMQIILPNGNYINIQEDNINAFLQNINNYDLM